MKLHEREKELLDAMLDMEPDALRRLEDELQMTFHRVARQDVPENERGTAKDTAVQRLAAWALKTLRAPDFRQHAWGALGDDPMTYGAIGERIAKVSEERVRQLFADLCPFEYEAQQNARRQA